MYNWIGPRNLSSDSFAVIARIFYFGIVSAEYVYNNSLVNNVLHERALELPTTYY